MSTDDASPESEPGRSAAARLDRTDRAMIAALRHDGRVSIRALAEMVHVSRTNAYARLSRMMSEGMITGFTALLNPPRVGLGTSAYVTLTIEQNTWRAVSARLREIHYIEHCTLVGGDFDVLVLVRTPDNAALRDVVLEEIQDIPGVRSTRTWLVFDEIPGRGVEWAPQPADSTD